MTQTAYRPATPKTSEAQVEPSSSIEATKPNGPAMAALLSAGIGVAVLGALTTTAEASADFANTLRISAAVGPLSGKTTYAVLAYALSWLVTGIVLRKREVNEGQFLTATFVLIAIGLLGTFPIFFDLFAPK